MKKKNILIVGLIIVILLVVSLLFSLRNIAHGPYDEDIKSFHYSYGSYFGGYYNYDIQQEGSKYRLTATGYNGVELNVNKLITKNDVRKIKDIVNQQKIYEWNGFDKSDDSVMDGSSFSLEIVYLSGETITASGYMKYPKEYEKRIQTLIDYLEKISK